MAGETETVIARNGGSRPVPDPTELTDKAIAKLKEQLEQYVDGQLAIRDERLEGIDEATKVRLGGVDNLRHHIDEKVQHLEGLSLAQRSAIERFAAADTAHQREISDIRFQAAEKLASRESELNALALAAAFAAQKEAASVQGTTFGDALASLGRIVETSLKGLGDKVDDVKDRVGRIESVATGAIAQRTEIRQNSAALYGLMAAVGGVIGLAITVVGLLVTRP